MEYLIPRFLCGALTGMLLSQTGSLMQMATRNILASPSTLGFDGLSVLWVLVFHSILLFLGAEAGQASLFWFGVPAFIFIGGLYSRFMGVNQRMERLILIGITFNLFVGAVFSLWQFLFLAFNLPFPVELWFGHFRYADVQALMILGLVELILLASWFLFKRELVGFSLGKTVGQNLNFRTGRLYLFIFLAVSVGTFAVVSLFGAFSFLGLVFPVVARKLWFNRLDLAGELILGAFLNGIFLMLFDGLCYYFPIYGAEVPVGLMATAIGAVSLIFLLWKGDRHLEILAKIRK